MIGFLRARCPYLRSKLDRIVEKAFKATVDVPLRLFQLFVDASRGLARPGDIGDALWSQMMKDARCDGVMSVEFVGLKELKKLGWLPIKLPSSTAGVHYGRATEM